ncbi:hypothetical protein IFM89_028930 [Coptis chinensis]|uniref:SWIM-type domain-containing protein n=1 Tax=Coptis chinensis TaxID=261450 RepID=A0A835H9X3_9MAGN|nr:hypothetical protein IFM89_028930 [Coptis chinensis]
MVDGRGTIGEKHEYRVDLRECTCNNWGIDGFPCRHAIANIYCKRDSVYSFIEVAFLTTSFSSTYFHGITAISRNEICSDVSDDLGILPPDMKRASGRPRVKRIESMGDMRYTAHKCRKCYKTDRHDRKTCLGKSVHVPTDDGESRSMVELPSDDGVSRVWQCFDVVSTSKAV